MTPQPFYRPSSPPTGLTFIVTSAANGSAQTTLPVGPMRTRLPTAPTHHMGHSRSALDLGHQPADCRQLVGGDPARFFPLPQHAFGKPRGDLPPGQHTTEPPHHI